MSNVQVLGAIELDVGTVSLLHYPKLAERNNQLRIADLPDYSFTVVNADNAKEEQVHVRIVNSASGEDYNREQVGKILGEKFGDLLRLEGVVKIYGNLLWDATVRPRADGDPHDHYNQYGHGGDVVYGPQYHEVHQIVSMLFASAGEREGFGRYNHNTINVNGEGETTISFPLIGGLEAQLRHPYADGLQTHRYHGASKTIRGSLVGPNGETWAWSVSNNRQRGGLELAGQMNIDELKSVIDGAFTKAYPWVPFEIKNFVAVVAENPHSTTTKTVELKLVS